MIRLGSSGLVRNVLGNTGKCAIMIKIKFYEKLYVSRDIRNPARVKWKLRHNADQFSVYVIALAEGDGQLEIYHCAFLQQKYYQKNPPYIVGIAGSYDGAVDIIIRMTEAALKENGNADLKQYLFPDTGKR